MAPMVARRLAPSPSFWRRNSVHDELRRQDGTGQASASGGPTLARSARPGSLENISTTGIVEAEAPLDHADLVLLVPQHEGDDDAALAGAGGAARAVQVGLVVFRRVVVDRRRRRRRRGCRGRRRRWRRARAPCRAMKSASAFSRAPWRRSPWMASARRRPRARAARPAGRRRAWCA